MPALPATPTPARRRLVLASSFAALGALLPWRPAAAAAPAIPLLGVWDDALDPARYLVSEKYDGVRGVWDGSVLRFRSGRPVPAPGWFTAALPRTPLDGELWLGRGRFDALSATVRRTRPVDAEWHQVRFMVFELPGAAGDFTQRARRIDAVVRASGAAPLVAVEQAAVADRAALRSMFDATIARGGEGLALHLASAPWQAGRDGAILKLKPSLDAEAVVIGHHAGRGKYAGQLGALELRTPEGRRFLLGSGLSDALRREPPPLGSVVSYRYRDVTGSGLPRFASFQRLHPAF